MRYDPDTLRVFLRLPRLDALVVAMEELEIQKAALALLRDVVVLCERCQGGGAYVHSPSCLKRTEALRILRDGLPPVDVPCIQCGRTARRGIFCSGGCADEALNLIAGDAG